MAQNRCGRDQPEAREQAAFYARAQLEFGRKYPEVELLHASLNGAFVDSEARAARLKAQGMLAGVLDLFLPVIRLRKPILSIAPKPIEFFSGLYIEMKTQPVISPVRRKVRRHTMSDEQLWFAESVRGMNYKAECANGQDEAIKILRDYLKLTPYGPIYRPRADFLERLKMERENGKKKKKTKGSKSHSRIS